ncbi:MAG: NADH-quinone oxidoreductase subunit NuoK [Candidatus Aminicenantales bacterium]
MIPVNFILGFGLIIFFIGLLGVLFRKNLVIMLMSLELLLNGVNILFAGFSLHLKSPRGSIFAIFVIIMAVSEAAVGFALILSYFRRKKVYDADELNELKG